METAQQSQMRALRLFGKEDIRLEQLSIPTCGPNEVRIKPSFVGICGTDVHEWSRGPTLVPTKPHILTGCAIPITLGHESSGTIDEVGFAVERLKPGQNVVVQPIITCKTCRACRTGRINVCKRKGFFGLSTDGGLADHLVVSKENVKALPDDISLQNAALIEPLAVSWHAVKMSGVTIKDSSALVIGAGPIGLSVVQALSAKGARHIIVSEPSEAKRKLALRFGATHAFHPMETDVTNKCESICDGEGVDLSFECVGMQTTLDLAVAATGTSGTIVNIAIWGGQAAISPNAFAMSEKRYVGSGLYTDEDFEEVIEAISRGQLKPSEMITLYVSLKDVVTRGIQAGLIGDSENQVKVLVDLSLGN